MTLQFELVTGSDLTLDREKLTIVRKARAKDKLPVAIVGDYFDYVSSAAMAWVNTYVPTYGTPMGTLFWNSIQLHENHYALNYDISITYSPLNKQSGTYQITVDQAVGTARCTAGTWQATYALSADDKVKCDGTFYNGLPDSEQGIDVPVTEDKISVAFRHPKGYLNYAYINRIGRLRGYPNNDTFLGYLPGEVMYMGGQFTQTDTEASAQYNFSISFRAEDLVVAGITIEIKEGWDALCPVYVPDDTAGGGGKKHATRKVKCIHTIRPRDWEDYVPIFGWGG